MQYFKGFCDMDIEGVEASDVELHLGCGRWDCNILGLYRDNGKENGNYHSGLYRDFKVYIGVIFKPELDQ